MRFYIKTSVILFALLPLLALSIRAEDVKKTDVYARIKKQLDALPAIDTHSHMHNPGRAKHRLEKMYRIEKPTDCPLHDFWRLSYFPWGHTLARWPEDGKFETWWKTAEKDFKQSQNRCAYLAVLPAFKDLYGVDYNTLDLEQARQLNERMMKNCEDPVKWFEEVIIKRANTELAIVDWFVTPGRVHSHFPHTVSTHNVFANLNGFHPSEFKKSPYDDPYRFAADHKLPIKTLDDYVAVLDHIFADVKKKGAVCLKSASAYGRTLKYDRVPKERAEKVFGRPRKELTPAEIKDFQDYIFWRMAELAAKHDLPFQIHTGHAKIPGSNPMNLVPLIRANPKTKFVLFHGGFPWVGEIGMIALKYKNVYLDSVWLPTLSYSMGKRALREWLEMISSDRIMWGSDCMHLECSYGMTIYARECIYETLAEMVIDQSITEQQAIRIGRQILRENALKVYPTLRDHLKKK